MTVRAIRAHVVTFRADPCLAPGEARVDHPDGGVLVGDGLVAAVGPWADVEPLLQPGTPVDDHRGRLVSAGFVDTHTHYPQTAMIGAYGEELLEWLRAYTFPEEQRFADRAYADAVATVFFDTLLAHGTTSALVFCSVHPESVDAFFAEAGRRGLRMAAGKVLMDRNAPDALLDTAERGYAESKDLITRWHGRDRLTYAVTPRFAPTSTPAQLEAAAALHAEHPGTLVHTHVSENLSEIAWVRALFPDAAGYLDVYDRAGLLGPRTVLAHGVHLTASERERCHDADAAIAHCPTSNLFLGSGLCPLHRFVDRRRPVRLGLGTDVGAGTSFSLLATMNEAYKVAQLVAEPLDAEQLFYLATLGGARALGLGDRIGSIEVGKEADLVVLDPRATPFLDFRTSRCGSLAEVLFVLATLGDDRSVAATYVAGRPAHLRDRDKQQPRPA